MKGNSPLNSMTPPPAIEKKSAQDWVRTLAKYREPNTARSFLEIAVTMVPFLALWALAWWSLSISGWLALGISVINAGFLVRLFAIQHDCGHGSFFKNRQVSDWVGRGLGILTVTPYDVWRKFHSVHHASAGNLERRGWGDIMTLTVAEYEALSKWGQLKYRMYRHPFVLFVIGPIYVFIFENRLPVGLMNAGSKYWVSSMGTNVGIAVLVLGILYFGGVAPLLLIFLPTVIIAAAIGVWLFYVQHQFEGTTWKHEEDWQVHDAALRGSSNYILPAPLQWMTANIGIHHVHHLYARIPFYRLPQVLKDNPVLATAQCLTLRESFSCVKLNLWDEQSQRLLSFAQAHQMRLQAA